MPTRKAFPRSTFYCTGSFEFEKKYFWNGFKEVHRHPFLATFSDGVEASFCSSILPLKLFLIYSEADYFLECCQLWKLCQFSCHLSALEKSLGLFYRTIALFYQCEPITVEKSIWQAEDDFSSVDVGVKIIQKAGRNEEELAKIIENFNIALKWFQILLKRIWHFMERFFSM